MILRLCAAYLGVFFPVVAYECSLNVQLVIVQDVSSGATVEKQAYLANELLKLSESMLQKYPTLKMGLTTFVDKPVAYLGWSSKFGGHPDTITDWCYRKETDLTDDLESFSYLLQNVEFGAGVDVPEAQYEGILRTALDSSIGWSDPTVDWFDNGTAPLRIMLVVTDSTMHLAGDGQKGLDMWTSQYGTQQWCDMPVISDKELCAEAMALKPAIVSGTATDAEQLRWEFIQTILGPVVFPAMKTHPGNLTGNDGCTEYDYPDWQYMVTVLEERKINPIYALVTESDNTAYNNWEWLSQQYTNTSIMAHFLYQPTFQDLSGVLDGMIDDVRDNWCDVLSSLTTEEPSTGTTESPIITTELSSSYQTIPSEFFSEASSVEPTSSAVLPTASSVHMTTSESDSGESLSATTILQEDTPASTLSTSAKVSDVASEAPSQQTSSSQVSSIDFSSQTHVETVESATEKSHTTEIPSLSTSSDDTETSTPICSSCRLSLEVVLALDASSSDVTDQNLPFIAERIDSLSQLLSHKYESLRLGLTTFVDKPIAYLGYSSDFGGHPDIVSDWCYHKEISLTDDFASLTSHIAGMATGGGADPREAQYEGILRTVLDDSLGWTDSSIDRFENGTVPLRIILLFTDEAQHLMGDGAASLEQWKNEYGTQKWCDTPMISDKELCAEAVNLKSVIDAGVATVEQLERWDYIQSILGPVEFPPMKVHPGYLYQNEGCTEYDYPDWPLIVDIVQSQKVHPIFALFSTDDTVAAGWQWLTEQYTNVSSHFLYNPPIDYLAEILEQAIDEAGEFWCDKVPKA